MEPPPNSLIKIKNDTKLGKYCVEIKLRGDPTSEKSELYELKMAVFDNGDPEEFLLFVRNFQMMLEASGNISTSSKI